MSPLLISEPPLQVLPSLAKAIGLNEAIVLQQLHYWLIKRDHVVDGRPWVYGTYEYWQKENFGWWHIDTVKRIFTALEKRGLVKSANLNARKIDRTKWYTIDYDALLYLHPSVQNALTIGAECPDGQGKMARSLKTETSPEKEESPYSPPKGGTRRRYVSEDYHATFLQFWDIYPVKKDKWRAWRIWKRDNLASIGAKICASVDQHKKYDMGWKKGYVKHPATYLNDKCWQDEFDSPTTDVLKVVI